MQTIKNPAEANNSKLPKFLTFPSLRERLHINILLPSLVRGGAERIVCDLLQTLRPRATATLMLLGDSQPSYRSDFGARVQVVNLSHLSRSEKLRTVAMEVLSSPTRVLYAHLIRARDLHYLSESGVAIVPVIHNEKQGWLDSPTQYNSLNIPFVIACADAIAQQLRNEGCSQEIVTLRHEIPSHRANRPIPISREKIRARYGIDEQTFLLGMVGQLKPQKNYSRAWQILAHLSQSLDVKLLICGGWHDRVTQLQYERLQLLAQQLEITERVIFAGDVEEVEAYYQAMDCYLSTSDYEGLSIAALEAKNALIPIVAADVGGTSEAISDVACLISPVDAFALRAGGILARYVEAIEKIVTSKPTISLPKSKGSILHLWWLLSEYGTSQQWQQTTQQGTLFIINNLNLAGAQRSLTNLLSHPSFSHECVVCTLDESLDSTHLARLNQAGVKAWTIASESDLFNKVERCLELLKQFQFNQICFWNAASQFKCLLSKILCATPVKIFDVSPGEMFYRELENACTFGERIAWTQQQYLARLNTLVVKYQSGIKGDICPIPVKVIPNGIDVKWFQNIDRVSPLDPSFNPHFAIGTCCRIAPVKRLEFLIEAQSFLEKWLPFASLTIVGGVHPNEQKYWDDLHFQAQTLKNIRFVGAVGDVRPYLAHFKVFVMVSSPGGCPNASLEAMAAGVPVVATRYGGAIDQIEDGKEGFLVSSHDPNEMAQKIYRLLVFPSLAKRMGLAAISTVAGRFSMEQMVRSYLDVLDVLVD
jgi:glycosyltransferase involved in cell wall biosynthesis